MHNKTDHKIPSGPNEKNEKVMPKMTKRMRRNILIEKKSVTIVIKISYMLTIAIITRKCC